MANPIFHSQYTAAQIEAAIGKGPRVNSSGYWEVWNVSTGAYESTGVGAGVNPPTVVTQVSQMTNHGYVYIYNGSETGYKAGYWYYWDGSAWTAGGAYQVAATDPTLSVSGAAADAKVTGELKANTRNLFCLYNNQDREIYGVTISVNGSEITFNGTATSQIRFTLMGAQYYTTPNVEQQVKYRFGRELVSGSAEGGNPYFVYRYGDSTTDHTVYLANVITFTHNDDRVILKINTGYSFNNAKYRFTVQKGEELLPYVPYGLTADDKELRADFNAYIKKAQTKAVKILGIGNSYTWYIFKYLSEILHKCGYTSAITGECYLGGSTLQDQYENRQSTSYYSYYRKYADDSNGLAKVDSQGISLETALQDEDWDFIVFQQQSDDAGQYASYFNNSFSLNDFIAYAKSYNPNARIGLVSPWTHATGYSGTKFTEYYGGDVAAQNSAINSVIPQVASAMTQCDFVIDLNKLVNSARQNTYLGALGVEMLQPDKNHIAYGIPAYMTGVLYAMCIGANISNLAWYPTTSDDSQITTPTNGYLAYLARQAAKNTYNAL